MHAWRMAQKSQGSSIVGLSRKGKEFFKMASPLSETIHHMAVQGARYRSLCGAATWMSIFSRQFEGSRSFPFGGK